MLKDGITPLFIAAHEGYEQIVQLLLEKRRPNVDLPDKVLLLILFFFFFFLFLFLFHFLIFLFFFYAKDGRTPLYVAAQEGYEQVVEILLKKGNANIDLATKVLF